MSGLPERAANRPHPSDPLRPSPLPPDLAEFLREQTFASMLWPTDQGTVFVIKAPGADIETTRGRVQIGVRHELYECPTAPVIRVAVTIYDRPDSQLAVETFINVEDPEQRADYSALAEQSVLHLFFYDEQLAHRLTKGVQNADRRLIREVLRRATSLYESLPQDKFDFDLAKALVMARTAM